MIAPEKPHHLIIADSQFLITESLKHILNDDGRFIVDKIVNEKFRLIEILDNVNVPLLIIDPSLPGIEDFTDLKTIQIGNPEMNLLIITNGLTIKELHDLNSIGIRDIILKTAGKEEIFEALLSTLAGRKFYSNELLELLFDINVREVSGKENGSLTNSELEIVRLISDGYTTKEIAAKKFISFHTVITHRKNIFRKLGVSSVSELIMYAVKSGWINLIEYHI